MNLFQNPEWESFKLATGYQKSYRIDDVLVLQKNLPLGFSMLYSPMVNNEERIMNNGFLEQIKGIARDNRSIFYRLELDVPLHNSSFIIHHSLFKKAFEEMQPEHTLILDISKSEDEILKQMKPKGRYNIKVAQKNQIKVVEEKDTINFFKLYSSMSQRHNISHRNAAYFQKLIDILGVKGYCKVFTAVLEQNNELRIKNGGENKKADQIPIASVIISFYGDKAIYLFGGSSDSHKNLMAPYLLQWTAIREAKSQGCTEYDFFGTAPPDKPNHPWRGVTDFKKKFGGQEIKLAGSWDLILRPLEYQLFKIAEKIRRK